MITFLITIIKRELLDISDYNYKDLKNNYLSKNKGYDQNRPLWQIVYNGTLKRDFRNIFQGQQVSRENHKSFLRPIV